MTTGEDRQYPLTLPLYRLQWAGLFPALCHVGGLVMLQPHLAIKIRLWLILPALAIIAAVGGGCSVARMALPEPLTVDTVELPVTGRQGLTWGQDLTFGEYQLTDIQRGWTESSSWSGVFWSRTDAHRTFQFTIRSPYRDDAVVVPAVTNARMEEVDFGGRNWSLNLAFGTTTLTVADCRLDGEQWSVILASSDETGNVMEGVITNGSRTIEIQPVRRMQGAAYDISETVGFNLRENDEIMGAIENINAGAVFMKRTLDGKTRDLLAIASGVIFIYNDVLDR
ncbi:hypothetical protein JXA80_05410 [bacterium]|nr:hypothetical protein [candidate division CSSED10-310 bacterium]